MAAIRLNADTFNMLSLYFNINLSVRLEITKLNIQNMLINTTYIYSKNISERSKYQTTMMDTGH